MGFTLVSLSPLVAAVHEVTVTLGAPAQDVTVGAVSTAVGQVRTTLGAPAQDNTVAGVRTALGSPAQDTTVAAVSTAVGQVRTTLGAPAQDNTVAGVRTALGSPAQDTTVAAVSTAVGGLHASGKTIAGELAVTSLTGTGLAKDATVSGVTTAVGQVRATLGAPAQDTTVAAVSTAVGGLHASGKTIAGELAVTSLAGTGLAQDVTVGGVTTAVGQVRTTLGAPAQDTTVAAVSTAVGGLHASGKTIAGELAVTSLTGTGLAKDATVAGVTTALGSPAQDTTVAAVTTAVGGLHASGKTIANEISSTGTPLITNSQLVTQVTATSLASGGSITLGPYAIGQIGYEVSLGLLASASSAAGGPVGITLAWYDSGTGIQVGKPRNWWLTGATSPLYQTYIGTGPTRGNSLKITIQNNDPSFSVSYQLVILQNSRIYANDDWEQLTFNNVPGWTLPFSDIGAGIIGAAAPTIASGAVATRLLPLYSGTVNVTGSTTSGENDGWVSILTIDPTITSGASVIHLNTNSQGNINQQDIALPRAQCYMYLQNLNAASKQVTASIFAQEQQTS